MKTITIIVTNATTGTKAEIDTATNIVLSDFMTQLAEQNILSGSHYQVSNFTKGGKLLDLNKTLADNGVEHKDELVIAAHNDAGAVRI